MAMATYVITFEVDSSQKNSFRERLKEFGTYCPIHGNCWAIVTDKKPMEILDFLQDSLSGQDRVFIIRSGTESAWRNAYGDEYSKWLKEKL